MAPGDCSAGAAVLSVAGMRLRFSGPRFCVGDDAGLRRFLSADAGPADIAVRVHGWEAGQGWPPPVANRCLFDSGGPWKLYDAGGRYVFTLAAAGEPAPYQVLEVETDFSAGDLSCRVDAGRGVPALAYPLDELLVVNLLAHHGAGVEVHALGIDDGGRGLLFVGVSGAGKSSAARLWAGQPGVTILSDDRIVLRRHEEGVFAYGTPWHGDAGLCDPGRTRLERIFFIGKSPAFSARPLTPAAAAARLFVCSFLPFWSAPGLERSLAIIESVVGAVPCFALDYPLDARLVDFARGIPG